MKYPSEGIFQEITNIQILWVAINSSSFPREAPPQDYWEEGLLSLPWLQDFCGRRDVLGHRYRETEIEIFAFCSDVIQFSRLAISRVSRSGQVNNPGYNQGRFLTMDKNKPHRAELPRGQAAASQLGRENHSMCPAPHGNAPHLQPLCWGEWLQGRNL